jgi:hypothetical protein
MSTKIAGLAGLGFIPSGFFGFNPLLAQTTNLGYLGIKAKSVREINDFS